MESLLEFAQGPYFIITFMLMVLGLFRVVYLQSLQLIASIKKLSYRDISLWKNVKSFAEWLIPVGHIYKNRTILSLCSFSFHVGILVVPIFLVSHIALWENSLGISWPGIPIWIADILTIITVGSAMLLLLFRVSNSGVRQLSGAMDYFLLILLTIPFISGFMAVHPTYNPLSYNTMMLIHIFSSGVIFVLIPCTKLVHCVMFPFDRMSSDVYWKMPVGAGEKIAYELHGEEVKV